MAENGRDHDAGMAGNGAAENGGYHAPAVAVFAANGVAENGGYHDPAVAVFAANRGGHGLAVAVHAANGVVENGGGHAPAVAVNAVNGAVENGGVPDPAPAVAAANGGNAALVHEAAAANGAMGNEGAVVMDLSLVPEAVIYQLFIRMPAAMVARCRAVCRMWRDLTSTEDFRRDHHFHRSRRPMPLFFYGLDHQVVPLDDHVRVHLRAVDIRRRESFEVFRFAHLDPAPPFVDPRVFRIEGFCDGILLLSYEAMLYYCNPCTRRWGPLPPFHRSGHIVGFYARDLSGGREYRVLFHADLNDGGGGCTYFILSFPNHWVRHIGRPTNLEAIDLVLAGGICPSFEMPPIMVQERLHWQPQILQDNCHLLVFDTAAELFSWMPSPRVLDDNRWAQVDGEQLLEINGRLAMIVVAPTMVGVWVLQDYVGQVWAYEYQIQLPVAAIRANQGYVVDDGYEEEALSAAVFAVSEERNVLIQCAHALLQCDANGTVLQTYQLPANCTVLSRYMLQESLLPHAFLPLEPRDAHDGHPPFFQAP